MLCTNWRRECVGRVVDNCWARHRSSKRRRHRSLGVSAQVSDPNQGRVAQTSYGTLNVLKDGRKYQIEAVGLSDEAIAGTPDGTTVARLDQLFVSSTGPFTFTTRNGLKTEQQLKDELSAAGYGGPWDVSSMLVAYGQAGNASAAAPAPVAAPAPRLSQ